MQFMQRAATRRQAILILAGAASMPGQTGKSHTTIHQEVDYKVAPSRVYEILLDAKQFSAVTNDSATIERRQGGAFKLFGGRIEGRNIEMAPNVRIVQAWREASWPRGVYTIAKFELVASGSGTRIVFDQTGIAENDWGHLSEGWPIRYWEPLHKYLEA
jgi:activator of HSP90 ATPase